MNVDCFFVFRFNQLKRGQSMTLMDVVEKLQWTRVTGQMKQMPKKTLQIFAYQITVWQRLTLQHF